MGVYRQFISVLYRIIRMVLRLFLPLERIYNNRRNRFLRIFACLDIRFLIKQTKKRGVT